VLRLAASLAALAAAGCALSHEMRPAPSASHCPVGGPGLISWYSPARSGDRASLARWCPAVGPAVIDAQPEARFPPWRAGDSLAVVTWNAAMDGGDLLGFIAAELDWTCGAEPRPGPRFSHFVLLLQEVPRWSEEVPQAPPGSAVARLIAPRERPGAPLDIVAAARTCGLALAYLPSARNGRTERAGARQDKGNAILSTLPLSDIVAIELPFAAQRRVEVAATVRLTPLDSLRAVSLHFDVSSTLFRTVVTGNSGRARQGDALLEALRRVELTRGGALATVLAGDANTWSADETVLKRLRHAFPDSPAWDGKPTRQIFPTDHIFFRRAGWGGAALVEGSYRRIENRYASDHHPRIAWIRLSAGQ
jgi:endonuclease/exonuclease/phosphatase family metal-dependent hydrolase